MAPSITNTMRRFSRGSSVKNSQNSQSSSGDRDRDSRGYSTQPSSATQAHPPSSYDSGFGSGTAPNGGAISSNQNTQTTTTHIGGSGGGVPLYDDRDHNLKQSRPVSSASNGSFEYMNRPVSQHNPQTGASWTAHRDMQPLSMGGGAVGPSGNVGALSRTDQVVLKFFWDEKYHDNAKRDLHFLKFPFFPQFPTHADLMPYCEIYHLVKTSPGASIISLGSANGVYIGFELAQGAQLHIDMDDEWRDISHHRVLFKPYETMLHDSTSDSVFKSWPKPLTIEFLEDQYRKWLNDLTGFCWIDEPVRELGAAGGAGIGEGSDVGI